ncbi:unnamed protein product, partial [Rotaria sp. Silwood2]
TVAPFITDQDLNKMSDHIFEIYDYDASGKLTFEGKFKILFEINFKKNMLTEFAEIYLMLNHYAGTSPDGSLRRDRFNYLLDVYDTETLGRNELF